MQRQSLLFSLILKSGGLLCSNQETATIQNKRKYFEIYWQVANQSKWRVLKWSERTVQVTAMTWRPQQVSACWSTFLPLVCADEEPRSYFEKGCCRKRLGCFPGRLLVLSLQFEVFTDLSVQPEECDGEGVAWSSGMFCRWHVFSCWWSFLTVQHSHQDASPNSIFWIFKKVAKKLNADFEQISVSIKDLSCRDAARKQKTFVSQSLFPVWDASLYSTVMSECRPMRKQWTHFVTNMEAAVWEEAVDFLRTSQTPEKLFWTAQNTL